MSHPAAAPACDCRICESYYRSGGNAAAAGRQLGLPRSTVWDHLRDQGRIKPGPSRSLDELVREAVRKALGSSNETPVDRENPVPPTASLVARDEPLVDRHPQTETILVIGDTHFPWVHDRAFSAVEEYAADLKPDLILHIGDLFDFHSISRHERDNFRTLQAEIDESRPYIERLAKWPGSKVVLMGNHDDRADRLAKENSSLTGVRSLDLCRLAELPSDWTVYGPQTHYRIGGENGIVCLHGDLRGGFVSGGKTIADRMRGRLAASCLFGHFHATNISPLQCDYQGNPERQGHGIGWLGDAGKAANYIRKPNWNLGFATLYVGSDPGDIEVYHHVWAGRGFRIGRMRYSG